MAGRPRQAPRQEHMTAVERALAPLLDLGQFIPTHLAREILSAPAPSWPRQLSGSWEPKPSGPVYELVAETAPVVRLPGDSWLDDLRSITFRVEGSPGRRANDWTGFLVRFSGRALHRTALYLAAHDLPISSIPPNIVLWHRDTDIFHDDVSVAHGHLDMTAARLEYQIVEDGPRPPTTGERKLIERGEKLFAQFPTTMTARGKPGSGNSEEQKRMQARIQLVNAAHELLHDDFPSPISVFNLTAALHMIGRGVYQMMDRAGWEIEDVQAGVNSVHMGCRNAG